MWIKNRTKSKQSCNTSQLKWDAHVVEYVNYVHTKTRAGPNLSLKSLAKDIPIYLPRFTPPTLFHHLRRHTAARISPAILYIKPLNIVHPFYYPELRRCPTCKIGKTTWSGWTGAGPCEVHGFFREERAFGFQIHCEDCQAAAYKAREAGEAAPGSFRTATTSPQFWANWQHFEIPSACFFPLIFLTAANINVSGTIPHFFQRCALTRELYDMIIEIRPTVTSGGLAENIKRKQSTFLCR